MDLVINQVMELHHIDVADSGLLFEGFTGAAIIQLSFAAVTHFHIKLTWRENFTGFFAFLATCSYRVIGFVNGFMNFVFIGTIEYWSDSLLTEDHHGPTQMGFQNLTDVHTRRHAERI